MHAKQILTKLSESTGLSPEKVRSVVSEALKELHKTAYFGEKQMTEAVMECYWNFGPKACFHFTGLLEQQRVHNDPDLPWSETLLRFCPGEMKPQARIMRLWEKIRKKPI